MYTSNWNSYSQKERKLHRVWFSISGEKSWTMISCYSSWSTVCDDYDCILFSILFKNNLLIEGHHHCQWKAAKVRHMLSTNDPSAGRDPYPPVPATTWGLGLQGLIRRTPYLITSYTKPGVPRTYHKPDPRGDIDKIHLHLQSNKDQTWPGLQFSGSSPLEGGWLYHQ